MARAAQGITPQRRRCGHGGDEAWRASSAGVRRVRVREGLREGLREEYEHVTPWVGGRGADAPRALAEGRRSECVVATATASAGGPGLFLEGKACAPDELARMPALRPWELALGVWNPHPILPEMGDEMHCAE